MCTSPLSPLALIFWADYARSYERLKARRPPVFRSKWASSRLNPSTIKVRNSVVVWRCISVDLVGLRAPVYMQIIPEIYITEIYPFCITPIAACVMEQWKYNRTLHWCKPFPLAMTNFSLLAFKCQCKNNKLTSALNCMLHIHIPLSYLNLYDECLFKKTRDCTAMQFLESILFFSLQSYAWSRCLLCVCGWCSEMASHEIARPLWIGSMCVLTSKVRSHRGRRCNLRTSRYIAPVQSWPHGSTKP